VGLAVGQHERGPGRPIKIVGTGLAAAVFLDAFILRTVLVPSIMHVFGKANWYFPRWLDKITPRVSVESPQPQDTLVHEKVNR
jgi:RND superfamily putative drug exporter